MISTDVDDVVASTSDNVGFEVFASGENINFVRATGAIDFNRLYTSEGHNSSSPGNIVFCNDKSIADRSAHDNNYIDARSAVDEDRRVLQVIIAVCTGATEEIGQVGHFIRIVRILT